MNICKFLVSVALVNYSIPMSSPDIGPDELKRVLSIFKTNWFSQGKITQQFEDSLSKYLSSNVSVVNNTTLSRREPY